MKLIRHGQAGFEKTGVIINDIKYDTTGFGEDYERKFFETDGLKRLEKFLKENEAKLSLVGDNVRLGPPIAMPSKIICVGLNYADHARETGAAVPPEPVLFMKAPSAVTGPFDDIIIPKGSVKTDWEVELAVVIKKKASYIDESEAED